MKFKPGKNLEMLAVGASVLMLILAVFVAVDRPEMIPVLLGVVLLYGIAWGVLAKRLHDVLAHWVGGDRFETSGIRKGLQELSQPVLLLCGKTVVWYNKVFQEMLLEGWGFPLEDIRDLLPELDREMCSTPEGQLLQVGNIFWKIHCAKVMSGSNEISYLFFHNETALREVEAEYQATRPGCIVIAVDGYDDVFRDMLDSERAKLLEGVNRTLETMIGSGNGLLRTLSRGRFLAVVEERDLERYAQERYKVLDEIRALDASVNLSVSIGVGRGAKTLHDAQEMAIEALDMAQGRGGDQTAEKSLDGFTFYGGVSHGVEKRSKVRSRIVAEGLVELIKKADHVVIMGHRMSDLDAIGAAEGVLRICKICGVPAVIAVNRSATMAGSLLDAFVEAGQGEDFISPSEALPIITKETLCIVVDTYQVNLVESREILSHCGKVVVIDHHRKGVGFIQNPVLVCHEPYASSASELVTELLQYVGARGEKPNRVEAEGLLAGIMLDTRNFSIHTGVRTFEAAAALRRYGAETAQVKALFNVSLAEYTAKSELVARAKMYKKCAVAVGESLPPESLVAIPQAANDLLSILDVEASFVVVKTGDVIKISARSMGSVNVQLIMERMGGGGHQTMAAAQLKNKTLDEVQRQLYGAIDAYREYQRTSSLAIQSKSQ